LAEPLNELDAATSQRSLIALLSLPACLVVVSTGPTSLTNATIVFVAIVDGGALVAPLRITVVSADATSDHAGTAWPPR